MTFEQAQNRQEEEISRAQAPAKPIGFFSFERCNKILSFEACAEALHPSTALASRDCPHTIA